MIYFKKTALFVLLLSATQIVFAQIDSTNRQTKEVGAPSPVNMEEQGVIISMDSTQIIQDTTWQINSTQPAGTMQNSETAKPQKDAVAPVKDKAPAPVKEQKAIKHNTIKEKQVQDSKTSTVKPVTKPVRKTTTAKKASANDKTMFLLKDSTVRHDSLLRKSK